MSKRGILALVLAAAIVFTLGAGVSLAAERVIKIAHNLPPTEASLYHVAALAFKEKVEKATGGKVEVQIFPSSQLGNDADVAKKVQSGAVEMEILTSNKLGMFYPEIDIYSLPFLLKDFDVAAKVFKTPIHQQIVKELEAKSGLKSLAFVGAGFRNITNSKHPINKPEELKDLKIRVPQNRIEIATFEAMGANPVNIPDSEFFSALQQKVVDGQDGSAEWAFAKKVYEVQKYLTVTHHQLSTSTMIIGAKYFASLPKDLQDIIVKAASEVETLWQQKSADGDKDVIERFKKEGMEIATPDLEPFIKAVQPVYDEFAPRVGGMDRIKAIMAVR